MDRLATLNKHCKTANSSRFFYEIVRESWGVYGGNGQSISLKKVRIVSELAWRKNGKWLVKSA